MIPRLCDTNNCDTNDYKIFAVTKMDDGYDIVALPQPLSIQYERTYSIVTAYVIEWQQDIRHILFSNLFNSFLVVYKYNKVDKTITFEVLHALCPVSPSCCSEIFAPITYKYRCSKTFVPTPGEAEAVRIMNDRFKNKLNKLRGNDIDVVKVDELQNESDNMNDLNPMLRENNMDIVLRNVARKIYDASPVIMPAIADIYYNAPYTTVKWANGSTTTVAATSDEEFNKEVGLAMAMSRKYCECMGLAHPRAGFKRMVNNAHDQTAKTAARKAYKNSKKLLKAADISSEESEDHGLNSNS